MKEAKAIALDAIAEEPVMPFFISLKRLMGGAQRPDDEAGQGFDALAGIEADEPVVRDADTFAGNVRRSPGQHEAQLRLGFGEWPQRLTIHVIGMMMGAQDEVD